MARTKIVPKRETLYTLGGGAFTIIRNQLKADGIEGVWSISKNKVGANTNIFSVKINKSNLQVQMRITGPLIVIIMNAKRAEVITEAVKCHATKQSPKKGKKLSQGSSSSCSDAEASDNYIDTMLDQGTLKVIDSRWSFKAQQFCDIVHKKYGPSHPINITGGGQCSVILRSTMTRSGEKRAMMNYWPSSALFTLTGNKTLRDGDPYTFFHKMIKDGPDGINDDDDDDDLQMEAKAQTSDPEEPTLKLEDEEEGEVGQAQEDEDSIDLDGQDNGEVIAVNVDVDDAEAVNEEGDAAILELDIQGTHSQFVSYLARQLIESVVNSIKGVNSAETTFKKTHARTLIPLIVLEQYISRTSQSPCPETSIVTGYLKDVKQISASRMVKWLEKAAVTWVTKAEKIMAGIESTDNLRSEGEIMMSHMRTIISTSSQTIAGLNKRVGEQQKALDGFKQTLAQLQKASANRLGKKGDAMDKPATKTELIAAERKLKTFVTAQTVDIGRAITTKLEKEFNTSINTLDKKLAITNSRLTHANEQADAERAKRMEGQQDTLAAKERIRGLEAKHDGGLEMTDEIARRFMLWATPEIKILIAQSVDRFLDGKHVTPQPESAPAMQIEYHGMDQGSPKRPRTDEGRGKAKGKGRGGARGGKGGNHTSSSNPHGNSCSSSNSNGAGSSSGSSSSGSSSTYSSYNSPGTSSRSSGTGERYGNGKGGKGKGGNRSNPQHELTLFDDDVGGFSLNLLDPATQETKPVPQPRWEFRKLQSDNVRKALIFAGIKESQDRARHLDNNTNYTYNTIRTGAFSATALERMIYRVIREQRGEIIESKINTAVGQLVAYLETLERRNNCPPRPK